MLLLLFGLLQEATPELLPDTEVIAVRPTLFAFLVGTILPLLVGAAAKVGTSSRARAVVAFLLSAVAALIHQLVLDEGTFEPEAYAFLFAATFLGNLGAYLGIWQPTGVTDALQRKVPGVYGGPART